MPADRVAALYLEECPERYRCPVCEERIHPDEHMVRTGPGMYEHVACHGKCPFCFRTDCAGDCMGL